MYDHYNVSLKWCHATRSLAFRFTCRHNPDGHSSLTHAQLNTSQGTSNLDHSRRKCMKDNTTTDDGPSNAPQLLSYSHLKHRALIAVCCVASRCPFNSVTDPYYIQEVEMLRPSSCSPVNVFLLVNKQQRNTNLSSWSSLLYLCPQVGLQALHPAHRLGFVATVSDPED